MTTTTLATIVLLGGFILLLMHKVPVTFALLLSTLGSALVNGTNLTVMVRMMNDGVSNFALLAIPFFILMGEIMSEGEVSDKIIDLANLIVGRYKVDLPASTVSTRCSSVGSPVPPSPTSRPSVRSSSL